MKKIKNYLSRHAYELVVIIAVAMLIISIASIAQAQTLICDQPLEIPARSLRPMALSTPYPAGYTKTVSVYIETDHDMYLYCNSDTAQVRIFVNGWFEQWRQLYLRDSILIRIDSIGYWKIAEPYTWTSSGQTLLDFSARMATVNPTADFFHFVSVKNNGFGGISYVGGVRQGQYACCFSHIYTSYYYIPLYSWTVEVMAHEAGHMLSSQHTHNCYWTQPSGITCPIDCLYTPEGGCTPAHPTQSGTIMSYGHITSFGIDFNKGFGPLPLAAIKQYIWDCYNSGFLKNPNAGLCMVPYVTSVTSTTNSAAIEWSNVGTKCKFKFKLGTGAWSAPVTTNVPNASITGLQSGKVYWIQVRSLCNGSWTNFSQSYKIKTK